MTIIDSHAHFPVPDVSIEESMGYRTIPRRTPRPRPQAPFAGRAREQWAKAWGFLPNEKTAASDAELAQRWVAELDRYGIGKIVWVTGGPPGCDRADGP